MQTIAAARSKLVRALERHPRVEVDCSATTEADVSLVQLLLAARQSADRAGKSIQLAASVSDPVRSVLNRSGVSDLLADNAGVANTSAGGVA